MAWMRRAVSYLLSLALSMMLLPPVPAPTLAEEAAPPDPAAVSRRALYVACDFFLSQEDTWPSSGNNIAAVSRALNGGTMAFVKESAQNGTLYSVEGLRAAILDTFGDADGNDVSYFYISTHGIYDPKQPNLAAGLLLSDGVSEETVTAQELAEAFAPIRGTKVLIIDACNSGAFIGKGLNNSTAEAAFLGDDFKVLASAGGSEESWYWTNADKNPGVVQGASYFSSALCDALGYHGEFGADDNRDGAITLSECYRYLWENHSASTPQSYPQEDDFVLLTYDADGVSENRPSKDGIISGVTFYDTVMDINQNTVTFEFTASRPVQMAYQLVYYRDGKWQFPTAALLYDSEEAEGDFGDLRGAISAGRKLRTLTLAPQGEDTYGYVMIQLVTLEGGKTTVHGSRVLCVPPVHGDPELAVKADPALDEGGGRELTILVNHRYPCLLSVSVVDESGKIIRRLASYQPTRPQQLMPAGSFFYWNGKLADGTLAKPGKFSIKATAYIGDTPYEAVSEPFSILK